MNFRRISIIAILWSLGGASSCAILHGEKPGYLATTWREQRPDEGVYQSSGIGQFFLPQLPLWVNFSSTANCRRNFVAQYFDLKKMRSSFNLSYLQALHFQYTYNVLYFQAKYQREGNYVPMKEEELLFYHTLDQTQSAIYTFRAPDFPRVHVIWIDPFVSQQLPIKKLQQFLASEQMSAGHPVFFSLCLNSQELGHFMSTHQIQDQNIRLLSYEMLSPFDADNNFTTSFQVDLHQLFGEEHKIVVFSPNGVMPMELSGTKIRRESF